MQHNRLKSWVRLHCYILEVIALRNSDIVKKKYVNNFTMQEYIQSFCKTRTPSASLLYL